MKRSSLMSSNRPHCEPYQRRQQPELRNQYHYSHLHLRLKCIVLGSAGAGKTSLLRCYIHGAFGGLGSDERSRIYRNTAWRSGIDSTPTLGADYYVKKVDNPLFRCHCGSSSNNCYGDRDASSLVYTESQVLVQLWDTAGRERLKPQDYPAQYDKKSNFYQFLSMTPTSSTNNSNYEHRYNNWGFFNEITDQIDSVHTLSTHRHERRENVYRKHRQHKQGLPLHSHCHNDTHMRKNNKPIGDALFRNIDACMLVYDATSSMSFLHLMRWHSEWVQKLNHWENEKEEDGTIKDSVTEVGKGKINRRKRIPFIVVANKLDLLEKECDKLHKMQSSVQQKHRSVMGFRGGEYKGKELKYEYTTDSAEYSWCNCAQPRNERHCKDVSCTKRAGTNYPPSKRLTFSLNETLWSTDAFYLSALQQTEDQLRANRMMILLWCERNGIAHVETSTLDGRGVNEAMEHLIKMGVEELKMREMEKLENMPDTDRQMTAISHMESSNEEQTVHVEALNSTSARDLDIKNFVLHDGTSANTNNNYGTAAVSTVDPSQYYFLYQPRQHEKLDLFARYSPKDEHKCFPFTCCPSLFSNCERWHKK